MLTVTKNLRDYLEKHHSVSADLDENGVRNKVADLLVSGDLELSKLKELTAVQQSDSEVKLRSIIEDVVGKAIKPNLGGSEGASGDTDTEHSGRKAYGMFGAGGGSEADTEEHRVRVKSVVEQFDDTKTALTYASSSNPFLRKSFGNRQLSTGDAGSGGPSRMLDAPTERTKAIAGAWLRWMVNKDCRSRGVPVPHPFQMQEIDQRLVEYAAHECKFVGPIGFDDRRDDASEWALQTKLTGLQTKTLLDDVTSGGLEAVPIEFDDAAILTPLLHGELFPLVTVRNVSRRRIEGFAMNNPELGWGIPEGSDGGGVSPYPFDTSSFITAFDTEIWPVVGAIELGLDFEADSPVSVGDMVINRYGERFKEEMDRVIAVGNGTNQPLGVFNTVGLVAINSVSGPLGPPTVTDYEAMMFGVRKEYRAEAGRERGIFLANEVTYARARGIAVDATDQRRVFGMDEEDYMLLRRPFKISHAIPNNLAAFVCMNRYRMYRRAGFSARVVTEDRDLALTNTRMIVLRARVGGQMEQSQAMAFINDMQA